MARQQKARVLIGNRQRTTVDAILRAKLSFEIRGPQIIRHVRDRIHYARMRRRAASPSRFDQAGAFQDGARRARRGSVTSPGMPRAKPIEQELRPPVGMRLTRGDDQLRDCVGCLVRTRVRRTAALDKAASALFDDTRDPLVPVFRLIA